MGPGQMGDDMTTATASVIDRRRDQIATAAARYARRHNLTPSLEDRDWAFRRAQAKLATSAADALAPTLGDNPERDGSAVWVPALPELIVPGARVRVFDSWWTGDPDSAPGYADGRVIPALPSSRVPDGTFLMRVDSSRWKGRPEVLPLTESEILVSMPGWGLDDEGRDYPRRILVLVHSIALRRLARVRRHALERAMTVREFLEPKPGREALFRAHVRAEIRRGRMTADWKLPASGVERTRIARATRRDLVALARAWRRHARALAESGRTVGICGEDDALLERADGAYQDARDLMIAARVVA